MQGEREMQCLERVRQSKKSWHIYGISYEESILLDKIISDAIPNAESNQFPDFLFEGGYIEHFQITSSKTTRKGSQHQKEYSVYHDKVKRDMDEIQSAMNYTPSFGTVQECHWSFQQPPHSYDNLEKSYY